MRLGTGALYSAGIVHRGVHNKNTMRIVES